MRKSVLLVSLITFSFAGFSQIIETVTQPRDASPAAYVRQTIGLSTISIDYSRPSVVSPNGQDRSGHIWGELVPYELAPFQGFGSGNSFPWRAGANENTVIEFSDNVKVEGHDLAAGKYGLFIAPHQDGTATIYFSGNYKSWGSFYYDPAEDVLKVVVKTTEIPQTERLTYNFIDLTPTSAVVTLDWRYLLR